MVDYKMKIVFSDYKPKLTKLRTKFGAY